MAKKRAVIFAIWMVVGLLTGCVYNPQQSEEASTTSSQEITPIENWKDEIHLLEDGGTAWSDYSKETDTHIYYVADMGIQMVDKQTGVSKLIYEGPDVSKLLVYEDELYFTTTKYNVVWPLDLAYSYLYKMPILGGVAEMVLSHADYTGTVLVPDESSIYGGIGAMESFTIHQGQFYLLIDSGYSVLQYDPVQEEFRILLEDHGEYFETYTFVGDYCYYIKWISVYRIHLQTGKVEEVLQGSATRVSQHGYHIRKNYFTVDTYQGQLYYTVWEEGWGDSLYTVKDDESIELYAFEEVLIAVDVEPSGIYCVCIEEGNNNLNVYRYDTVTDELIHMQTIPTSDTYPDVRIIHNTLFYNKAPAYGQSDNVHYIDL